MSNESNSVFAFESRASNLRNHVARTRTLQRQTGVLVNSKFPPQAPIPGPPSNQVFRCGQSSSALKRSTRSTGSELPVQAGQTRELNAYEHTTTALISKPGIARALIAMRGFFEIDISIAKMRAICAAFHTAIRGHLVASQVRRCVTGLFAGIAPPGRDFQKYRSRRSIFNGACIFRADRCHKISVNGDKSLTKPWSNVVSEKYF